MLALQRLHSPPLLIAVVFLSILTVYWLTPTENMDWIVLILTNCDSMYHGVVKKEKNNTV